jgi:hypothetical protein
MVGFRPSPAMRRQLNRLVKHNRSTLAAEITAAIQERLERAGLSSPL